MGVSDPFVLGKHVRLTEPRLRFGSTVKADVDINPLQGLLKYEPYSKNWIVGVPDAVKIAFIGSKSMIKRLRNLLSELNSSAEVRGVQKYMPIFKGISTVFGVSVVEADTTAHFELPDSINEFVQQGGKSTRKLAKNHRRISLQTQLIAL